MSLLKKASIITTPTAYAEDYLYSIKPAYALGSELVTNGTFDTDSDWTKGSGWTISGGKANRSGASINSYVGQDFNVIAGRNYIVKYDRTYVSGDGQTNLFSYFEGNSSRSTRGNYEDTTQETVTVTDYFKPEHSGNLSLRVYGISDFTGSINNVSVKEVTDADFDFDRNSTGTRVNEDYLIEDVPYNFASYSESFENWSTLNAPTVTTNIALAPDGTFTADGLQDTTGGTFRRIKNSISVSGNPTFTGSCYIKKVSSETAYTGFVLLFSGTSTKVAYGVIDSVNGTITSIGSSITPTFTVESANNDYWRFSMTATDTGSNTSLEFGIYATLSTNKTTLGFGAGSLRTIWGAQLVKGDQPKEYLKTTDRLDIPRIDYTNGEPSILLEPQRTNLVIYSNNVSSVSGNFVSNIQINSSNNLSPEGINNAQEIEVTGGGQPRVESVITSNTTVYAVSGYVKKVTGDFFGLGFYQQDIGNQFAKFNLDTGTFVAVSSNGAVSQSATNIYNCQIIPYKNNWYRITCNILTGSAASKSNLKWLAMSEGTGSSSFSNGVVGDKFLIYGRQVEQASYATSLIHTSGSTVTRSADAANNAGNSDLFNDSEGVLYCEIKGFENDAISRPISISDGDTSDRINLFFPSSQTNVTARVTSGGADQFNATYTSINQTVYNKLALKYKANDFALWLNGVEILTDSSGLAPNGLKVLAFNNASGTVFRGNVKSVMVFKEALTDLELEKLTGYNNHELYMNYYNRLSYLGLVEEYNVESDINNYIL